MGYWPAKGALAGRGRLGRERVVVTVPPAQVRPVVTEGLAAGAHCFTVNHLRRGPGRGAGTGS
ncbi:hypothetical protein ABT072_34255 [Streptomyces sp. NPDC002589]|uniref:hypothetical protein n=1 Tax=Streptomyces sp. NPDC002589 TaxID=3154420 RepID=UPI00331B6B33